MAGADLWLRTPRLGLRRFTSVDLEWLVALRADPDVMRHAGGPQDQTKTEDLFNTRFLAYYDEHPGLGSWVTVERSTETPVGFHLLNHVYGESLIQVGFFLMTSAWGRGFGTEMASALLRYGFVDLALPRIVALTSLDNKASQRVLLKIGLHRHGVRTLDHPVYAAAGPVAWFEREAADWRRERSI